MKASCYAHGCLLRIVLPLERNAFSLAQDLDEFVVWIWEQELERAELCFLFLFFA